MSPNVDENLNAIFNIDSTTSKKSEINNVPVIQEQQHVTTLVHEDIIEIPGEITEDHERTRANFYELIRKGNSALDTLLEFVKDSENPRAYEVLATLLKNIGEINERIIDQQQKIENIKNKRRPKDQKDLPNTNSNNKVVNNSIFVGSTKDLQELIKQQHNIIDQ